MSPTINEIKPPNYRNDFSNLIEIALAGGGNVGGPANTNATPSSTGNATNATTVGGASSNANTTQRGQTLPNSITPSRSENPPIVSESPEEPWWAKPEILVPIIVAIIGSVIGPLVVSRYGKKHSSKDNTE